MNTIDLDKVNRSVMNQKPWYLWQTSSADFHVLGQKGNSVILWFGDSQPALLIKREFDWIVVAWATARWMTRSNFKQFWAVNVFLSAVGVLKGHHGCMDIALWNSRCELTLIQLAWNKQMAGPGCPTLMSFLLFKYTEQWFNPFSSLVCYKNKHCSIPALSMWWVRLDICVSVYIKSIEISQQK